MPRDDLSIDFVHQAKAMPLPETDPALILDEWTNRVSNLPEEIKFIQEEIGNKDLEIAKYMRVIEDKDTKIQRWIKANGSHEPNIKEHGYRLAVRDAYDKAEKLQDEKIKLTQRLGTTMDRHLKWIDAQIKTLYDRNEPGFLDPDELPSVLRPAAATLSALSTGSVHPAVNPAVNPITAALSPLPNLPTPLGPKSAGSHIRNVQASQHVPSSAPASPAATMGMKRGPRESSTGPGSGPLQRSGRVNIGLASAPAASSGLARHSSLGPGTPKGHTTAVDVQRAGSAGPRAALKGGAVPGRKGTPSGGMARSNKKGTPGVGHKSGLHRVRKTVKNSPSSTVESELSEADSRASGEESDVPRIGGRGTPGRTANEGPAGLGGNEHVPRTKRKDDQDISYMDEDDGSDDKKYCICQKVSFGDMIACDNDECPYEWFHWSCVGLKSEPQQGGTWYCPVCTDAMKKKAK